MRPVRLGEVAHAVLRLVGPMRERVDTHVDLAFDEPFLTDPGLVHQVLMNLVLNACEAIEHTGGNVWVTSALVGSSIEIRVSDDGPGIAPEDGDRIFMPFFTTKAPGAGTGLGLSISRQRVMRYGGTLEVVPRSGGGAEFRMVLPYVPLVREGSS